MLRINRNNNKRVRLNMGQVYDISGKGNPDPIDNYIPANTDLEYRRIPITSTLKIFYANRDDSTYSTSLANAQFGFVDLDKPSRALSNSFFIITLFKENNVRVGYLYIPLKDIATLSNDASVTIESKAYILRNFSPAPSSYYPAEAAFFNSRTGTKSKFRTIGSPLLYENNGGAISIVSPNPLELYESFNPNAIQSVNDEPSIATSKSDTDKLQSPTGKLITVRVDENPCGKAFDDNAPDCP